MLGGRMEYLSTTQIAQKWGISSRRIQKMCTEKKNSRSNAYRKLLVGACRCRKA